MKTFFKTLMAFIALSLLPLSAVIAEHPHKMGGMKHDHSMKVDMPTGGMAPTLAFTVAKDPASGWNVHIKTSHFKFAPEHASLKHKAGEGHAHIYVNGKKLARVYGAWFHIGKLASGKNKVTVTLTTNDHKTYSVGGKELTVSQTVMVP